MQADAIIDDIDLRSMRAAQERAVRQLEILRDNVSKVGFHLISDDISEVLINLYSADRSWRQFTTKLAKEILDDITGDSAHGGAASRRDPSSDQTAEPQP